MKNEELKKLELLKEREDINEEVLASVIKRISNRLVLQIRRE